MTAREQQVTSARLSMVLPGTWANIPLDSPERSDAAIADLVKRQVGRDDRLATARRDARERLKAVARDAREVGAVQLALAMELLPGIPFPASLMADYREWPALPDEPALTVGAALERVLPGGDVLDLQCGATIRQRRATTVRPGDQDIRDVKLEYFVCVPDMSRLLHVVVDTPMQDDAELMSELFDSIVDSIRWYPDEEDPTRAE